MKKTFILLLGCISSHCLSMKCPRAGQPNPYPNIALPQQHTNYIEENAFVPATHLEELFDFNVPEVNTNSSKSDTMPILPSALDSTESTPTSYIEKIRHGYRCNLCFASIKEWQAISSHIFARHQPHLKCSFAGCNFSVQRTDFGLSVIKELIQHHNTHKDSSMHVQFKNNGKHTCPYCYESIRNIATHIMMHEEYISFSTDTHKELKSSEIPTPKQLSEQPVPQKKSKKTDRKRAKTIDEIPIKYRKKIKRDKQFPCPFLHCRNFSPNIIVLQKHINGKSHITGDTFECQCDEDMNTPLWQEFCKHVLERHLKVEKSELQIPVESAELTYAIMSFLRNAKE